MTSCFPIHLDHPHVQQRGLIGYFDMGSAASIVDSEMILNDTMCTESTAATESGDPIPSFVENMWWTPLEMDSFQARCLQALDLQISAAQRTTLKRAGMVR